MNKKTKTENVKPKWQVELLRNIAKLNEGVLLFLFICNLLIPMSAAQIEISSLTQMDIVESGSVQTVGVSIQSDTNITSVKIQILGQNKTMASVGGVFTYSWQVIDLGVHEYTIVSTNAQGDVAYEVRSFMVEDSAPPQIVAFGPNNHVRNNPVELTIITDEDSTCKYDSADISYESMRYLLPGAETVHHELKILSEGNYEYYVICQDASGNLGSSKKINFELDTIAPQATLVSPSGVVSEANQYLRISTNEPATCSYSQGSVGGAKYAFESTGSLTHEAKINLIEGLNNFFVTCIDSAGNSNVPSAMNLELNLAPKASITVEGQGVYERLKQGTYLVRLDTSESISGTPSLAFICGAANVGITLQGSGSSWNGYLLVSDGWGRCSGEFRFAGYDLRGSMGTEITSGKIIQVDTVKPKPVVDMKIQSEQDGKIKISWTDANEERKEYRIYRSTSGNTGVNDFRFAVTQTQLVDGDIAPKTGYFYRVSVVGKSGIESDLSEEIFMMSQLNVESVFKQDAKVIAILEPKIGELERLISDLDKKSKHFEDATDDVKTIVKKNGIVEEIAKARGDISLLLGELRGYLSSKIAVLELNDKVAVIDSKISAYKKQVPEDIVMRDSILRDQVPDFKELNASIVEFLNDKSLAESQKIKYYSAAERLYQKMRVSQEILTYDIFYPGGMRKEGILISESLVLPDSVKNAIVIQEVIPRNTLQLSKMEFEVNPVDINQRGPYWKMVDLPEDQIVYSQDGMVDLNKIVGVITVPLPGVDDFLASLSSEEESAVDVSDAVTGAVVMKQDSEYGASFYAMLVLGLVVIGLLAFYLFSTSQKSSIPAQSQVQIYADIRSIIADANRHLSEGDLNAAADCYAKAREAYVAAKGLGYFERAKLKLELNILYEKLLLKAM